MVARVGGLCNPIIPPGVTLLGQGGGWHSVFPKILGPLFGSLGRLFGSLIFQLVIENILSRKFGPRQNMQHWGLSMTFGSFVDKHRWFYHDLESGGRCLTLDSRCFRVDTFNFRGAAVLSTKFWRLTATLTLTRGLLEKVSDPPQLTPQGSQSSHASWIQPAH